MRRKPVPVAVAQFDPDSPVIEDYRDIRTSIQFMEFDRETQVVLFTSAQPREGKTSTAVNVAIVYAQAGKDVLLVDGDLRRPAVAVTLGVSGEPGLSTILAGASTMLDSLQAVPGVDHLWVLPAGPVPPNPSELLLSARLGQTIQECRTHFDYIFLDSPPVGAVTDSLVLAQQADGTVVVVNAESTGRYEVQKTVAALQQVQVHVLGAILNRKRTSWRQSYPYYRGQRQ